MLKIDTESCGLVGPLILIQYQKEREPVEIYNVWKHTVRETLSLIEWLLSDHLVAYHMAHDAFHLAKTYNTYRQLPAHREPVISEVDAAERKAWDGPCLKPKKVTDLMVLLIETNFQYLGKHKPLVIRLVPMAASQWLFDQLQGQPVNKLLFAKKSNGYEWKVDRSKDRQGRIVDGFVDLKLEFAPSYKLKDLSAWNFDVNTLEIGVPKHYWPNEQCPFADGKAKSLYRPWGSNWPEVIKYHIAYWSDRGLAYAEQDILLLTIWDNWLQGFVPTAKVQPRQHIDIRTHHSINSELTWSVGVSRQRGFAVDLPLVAQKLEENRTKYANVPTAPAQVLAWLFAVATPEQKLVINGTSDQMLEQLEINFVERDCKECQGHGEFLYGDETVECSMCKGKGKIPDELGKRAATIRSARSWDKQELILKRLLHVGRFHPDFNVLGTNSNRMSGSGGINPQGIDRDLRSIFLLSEPDYILSGGDFDKQELTIAAAVYQDEQLSDDITKDINICGDFGTYRFDIHAWGAFLLKYPECICENCHGVKCEKCDWKGVTKDSRHLGKNGLIFPTFYGSMADSIARKKNIANEIVHKAHKEIYQRWPGFAEFAKEIAQQFSALVQEGSVGSNVEWINPQTYIENIFGFRRYFEAEQQFQRALFNLARQVPRNTTIVTRRPPREQTVSGATSSALYATAFGIQQAIIRIAANQVIQSVGAELTKRLQLAIWGLQPEGVTPWVVQPFNVHDEIMCPNNCPEAVSTVVAFELEQLRQYVPLCNMQWKTNLKNWGKK